MLFARKLLALSAVLFLGGAFSASAADLGGSSLKDVPMMESAAAPSGWYVRVDGGYNWYADPTIDVEGFGPTTNISAGSAWSIGGGIGRYIGRGFRGDITVDHLFDSDITATLNCSCGTTFGDTKTSFDSTVVLVNLYYDFNRGGRFVPYIGGGIGFAHNETSGGLVLNGCNCVASYDGASENSFAAAAMAGVSWKIRGGEPGYVGGLKDQPVQVSSSNALYLDFGYRFLYLGDAHTSNLVLAGPPPSAADAKIEDIMAHQIRVGLRYDLN